jgi:hypothetical protein
METHTQGWAHKSPAALRKGYISYILVYLFLSSSIFLHTCARFLYGYLGVEELERGPVWIGLNQAE